MKQTVWRVEDYIVPLNMDGLAGRMLYVPAPKGKNREILFVYGHHSSLERWGGVIQDLNQYGAVTMPDLPGFGGMDSLYKRGEQPTVDNLADYLAAFVKLRYRRKKVTIAGLSFGFVVVTRMLQRYPELVKQVDVLISVVGFAHHDDFTFSRSRYLFYRYSAGFFSYRVTAAFFRNICLHPLVLKTVYRHTHNAKDKFVNHDRATLKQLLDFEVYLWRCNEVQTYMKTTVEFLTLDNCAKQVDLPVWHVSVKTDKYFDNHLVEQHMRVVFNDFHNLPSKMDTHAPSVIADMESAAPLLPKKLRQLLNSQTS